MIIKNSQWKSSWQHPNEWLYQIEFESFLLFIHSFIHFSYRRIFKQISFIADKKAFGETFFFSLSVLSTINRLSEEYMLERERAREWEKNHRYIRYTWTSNEINAFPNQWNSVVFIHFNVCCAIELWSNASLAIVIFGQYLFFSCVRVCVCVKKTRFIGHDARDI